MAKNHRICSVENCGKRHVGRGYCEGHYRRLLKHGDPLAGGTADGEPLAYLMDQVLKYAGDDCLIWPYARHSNGYAQITIDGSDKTVSRLVCELVNGPAPEDHDAAHSCGNGHLKCVAPKHLRWATRKENIADAIQHGTFPLGARRWNAKITPEIVLRIRAAGNTKSRAEISQLFGVSKKVIEGVQSGKNWSWVK